MRLALPLVLLTFASAAHADMMGPTTMPAPRVIKNLEARIAKNPKDGQAEYMLGRIYYSLYCDRDPRSIRMYGTVESPHFPSVHTSPWEITSHGEKPDDAESISNAKNSLKHLRKAIRIGGGEPGLYQLTLACLYEASQASESKIETRTPPFRNLALQAYLRSFNESKGVDEKRPTNKVPMTWESWISVEAAAGILRLDPQSKMRDEIVAHQKKVDSLPPAPITPLIFSLSSHRSLEDLLDPSRVINFDLDGTGSLQRYGWIKSDTGFLVWTPKKGEPIRSGRQLFGSATWWVMPKNGYEAMSLLDDDGDGWLTGQELESLSVWFDRNQNGFSDPGEVVPVQSLGIVGLRTAFSGRIGGSYVAEQGIRLSDGRILPSYDWVTRHL